MTVSNFKTLINYHKDYEGLPESLNLTSVEIEYLCDEIIEQCQKVHDKIVATPTSECNFITVFKVLGQLEGWLSTYTSIITFPQYVSTEIEIREAAAQALKKLTAYEIDAAMREDLYQVCQIANSNSTSLCLEPEDHRLMTKIMLEFKRNGLHLPNQQRQELRIIYKRLKELEVTFAQTIANDTTIIKLTKDELKGMSEEYLGGLQCDPNDTKRYIITMKYPDINPLMETCTDGETRRRVEFINNSRCFSNVAILEEALTLRYQAAKLLGYENHAEYILELKMAQTTQRVENFFKELISPLTEYAYQELPRLLKMKQQFEPDAIKIESWDVNFCKNQLLKQQFQVDHDKIKEYFPLDHVTKQMLSIYQDVLGLEFDEIIAGPNWIVNNDIKLIRVRDQSTKDLMGYFYLDLFPRPGKFTHAACFSLQPGYEMNSGKRQVPISAMIANFSPPGLTQPSLLRHSELIVYFHELGHVMHSICSQTKYGRFHGLKVEGDFVETPSQMLESWCWNETILIKLSQHYVTKLSLPINLIQSLLRVKNIGAGLNYLRQLFLAKFDMQIHSITYDNLDLTNLFHQLRSKITLIPNQPETFPMTTFAHLMSGYDAGYYGYLWSLVYATDMYTTQFSKYPGALNLNYRNLILKPGGSKDGLIMLREFLGRDPNPTAFLQSLTTTILPQSFQKR